MATPDDVQVDDVKTSAIKNPPTPTISTELRSFYGLAGYYRSFIKELAKVSSVLDAATSGKAPLEWTADMNRAF